MEEKVRKMSAGKITGFVFLGLFILFIFSGGCFAAGFFTGGVAAGLAGSPAIATGVDSIYLIRLEGVISGSQSDSFFGGAAVTPEYMIEQFREAEENPDVKAILIRVNSGGGSAAASQEIFEELKKIKKPVVVSVGDICASGAYYISCAADEIIVNRSSSVGSIGVIMQIPNLEELYNKLGIKYTTIKQGIYKDAGSSDRELTVEEEELFRTQTFKIYDQFIKDVAASRNLSEDKVREIATGWVYLGTEAEELGLVDRIGTYRDAELAAASLGGIKGEPSIIGRTQYNFLDMLLNYSMNYIFNRFTLNPGTSGTISNHNFY
jgi:protease-4